MLILETNSSVEPQPQHLKTKEKTKQEAPYKDSQVYYRPTLKTTAPPMLSLSFVGSISRRKSTEPGIRRARFHVTLFWY